MFLPTIWLLSLSVSPPFFFFLCITRAQLSPRCHFVEVSRSHTITQPVGLLWMSDQPIAETSTYTTHNKQEMNICALSRVRTHDPRDRGATDLRLRPNGQQDSVTPFSDEYWMMNDIQIRNYCRNLKRIQGGFSCRTQKLYRNICMSSSDVYLNCVQNFALYCIKNAVCVRYWYQLVD